MVVKTKEEELTFSHLFFFRFIYKGPTKKQKPSLPPTAQPSRLIDKSLHQMKKRSANALLLDKVIDLGIDTNNRFIIRDIIFFSFVQRSSNRDNYVILHGQRYRTLHKTLARI